MQRIVLVLALIILSSSKGWTQNLQVSENGKYIETEKGQPFFWLGDTAWELFHRLDLNEARHYPVGSRGDTVSTILTFHKWLKMTLT